MGDTSAPGTATLEQLERANMFIVPLDDQRRWYRYHHLFADALRQRLQQSLASSAGDAAGGTAELHVRASAWYEENGLEIEAFHHAAEARDFPRAERLIEGRGCPVPRRFDPRAELAEVTAEGGAGRQAPALDGLRLGHAGHGPGD
jgi:LuxR family maltose regulon positive regulatory protein